ncbi:MAG TPA: hypothetical protein VL949_14000 [Geobacteraceae bacterium]|jgi:hypothetical protein|nr:hypothetical protein [Geobacteraceae bacterium]
MNILKALFQLTPQAGSCTARVCRTRKITEQVYECRVKRPSPRYCEHSLSMGDGYLCKHHDRSGFAQR